MKASQIAKQFITKEYVEPIFIACQQQLYSAPHICVSRELNESDIQIIGEVILDSVCTTIDKTMLDQPKIKRAIIHRAEGLFKQWLLSRTSKKETPNA